MLNINWSTKIDNIKKISNKIRIEGTTLFTTTDCNLDCIYCCIKERRRQVAHIGSLGSC